jgi:hypothetical protein
MAWLKCLAVQQQSRKEQLLKAHVINPSLDKAQLLV